MKDFRLLANKHLYGSSYITPSIKELMLKGLKRAQKLSMEEGRSPNECLSELQFAENILEKIMGEVLDDYQRSPAFYKEVKKRLDEKTAKKTPPIIEGGDTDEQ